MKLGTQIKLPDGREGTVTYNGLEGVGIVWGLHDPNPKDFEGSTGGLLKEGEETMERLAQWEPTALLREPWDSCENVGWKKEQCMGSDFEITRMGLGK